MIVYEKLRSKLAEQNITSYRVRQTGEIGQATWHKIQTGGHIDTRTIDALCRMLQCQPGDILEYVPDSELKETSNAVTVAAMDDDPDFVKVTPSEAAAIAAAEAEIERGETVSDDDIDWDTE